MTYAKVIQDGDKEHWVSCNGTPRIHSCGVEMIMVEEDDTRWWFCKECSESESVNRTRS